MRVHNFSFACALLCAGASCGKSDQSPETLPITSIELSPDAQQFLDELTKLTAGQPADLDGDGFTDTTASQDGDSLVWNYDPYGNGFSLAQRVWNPMTNTEVIDFRLNPDRFPRARSTTTGSVRELLEDRDEDGVYDWKRTDTRNYAEGSERTVIEEAPDGDGTFAVRSDETHSLRKGKCPRPPSSPPPQYGPRTCEVFPAGGVNSTVPGYDMGTYTSGTDADTPNGRCGAKHAAQLTDALSCAMQRYGECIRTTNEDEWARFALALPNSHIHLACGNRCANEQAGAIPHEADVGRHYDINWNPVALDGIAADELCAAMLHELMHFAESPDDGENHGLGDDLVYSCGRYCGGSNGCSFANRPPGCGITDQEDCAACASQRNKIKCGAEDKWITTPKPPELCRDGAVYVGNVVACDQGLRQCTVGCDGTVLQCQTSQPCCTGCPGSTVNTFPCGAGVVEGKLAEPIILDCNDPVCPPKPF